MRLLITGGAGFIGSHLTDLLLSKEHEVVCIDDLSLGRIENIAHLKNNDKYTFIKLDVLDKDELYKVFSKYEFDCVFHLAANSDIQKGAKYINVDFEKTFLTTFRTLEAMKEFGVKNLVFASTSAIYGELTDKLNEDIGPLFPISFYGAAKLSSEAYISAASENFGIKSWIFRFPNVVGERATHGAMYDFINRLEKNPTTLDVLGDGTQEKPYLYVKDLVDGITFGWENSGNKINYFNLGVENETKVSDIANMVIEEMGLKDVEVKYSGGDRGWVGDVPKVRYDMSKINSLGWKPKVTSDEAMRIAIKAELKERNTK